MKLARVRVISVTGDKAYKVGDTLKVRYSPKEEMYITEGQVLVEPLDIRTIR